VVCSPARQHSCLCCAPCRSEIARGVNNTGLGLWLWQAMLTMPGVCAFVVVVLLPLAHSPDRVLLPLAHSPARVLALRVLPSLYLTSLASTLMRFSPPSKVPEHPGGTPQRHTSRGTRHATSSCPCKDPPSPGVSHTSRPATPNLSESAHAHTRAPCAGVRPGRPPPPPCLK